MDGILLVNDWQLRGVNAEVVSVLRASGAWDDLLPNADWGRVAHALDTRTPPDERVTLTAALLREIQRRDPVARWLPRFDRLPEHEFRQEFYPGYRDHTIHTLQMWLLGLYLFETVSSLREPLVARLRARSASDDDASLLFRRWWTPAALWHDAGYPFESEELATDSSVRAERLNAIADALSSDAFQDGLRGIGIEVSPGRLAKIHQAGRRAPFVVESVIEFLEHGDPGRIIDGLWRRLGLQLNPESRAEVVLDNLTMKATAGRRPFHDHGTFGAILLLRAASSASDFLTELTDALGNKRFRDLADGIPRDAKSNLDDACLALLESRQLIEMAAEAISYHNFDFRSVDGIALNEFLGPTGARPVADLASEPHIVFLAVADTLQDWDRHHFVPRAGQYRPAVASDKMLLQGIDGRIRVSLAEQADPAKRVLGLFKDWISGLDPIFVSGAQFSRPADIQDSKLAPTISAVEDSAARLGHLRQEISSAATRALAALRGNQPRALIDAAEIIEPVLGCATQARPKLTPKHQSELDSALRSAEMQNVQRHAVLVIQPGTQLPIGQVQERIGGGGFGEVYRVVDTSRSGTRILAFKLFHGRELDDLAKRSYFERGFRAMSNLRYERGVVAVDRMLYVPFGLSMEYVEGINLEEATKERRDVHERLRLLQRVSETLASAHNKGIIHRDVKPANVLLDSNRDGEPVLTDFDLAHIVSGKTTVTSALFASQLYGAPEQFNKRWLDWSKRPCVDVYGFGALMFHVLTFREPPISGQFGDEQWGLVRQSIGNLLPATAVSRLVQLLREITCSDPRQRLSNWDDLVQMEHIVRELTACRRESLTAQEDIIPWNAWAREVAYIVTGETEHDNPQEFNSCTAGTSWRIERRERNSCLAIRCTLNRDPQKEGVNFEGFSRSSNHQVSRILANLGKIGKAPRAQRHGQLGSAGSAMTIEIQQLELTRCFAHQIGELISALARAVE